MAPSDHHNHSTSLSSNLLTHRQYATDHILQSYEVYIPSPPPQTSHTPSDGNNNKIWLIYIHGGAWRAPTITALNSFVPTLSHLLNPPLQPSSTHPNPISITGYISLSYRLSPHPSHPQTPPPTTPPSSLRNATHPDHIHDILSALRFLQRKHAFGNRYILVGHSCGGTLAWQVAMSRVWEYTDFEDVRPPLGIVSVCGIYHLPLLVRRNQHVEAYREFVVGAFGAEEEVWEAVSPARWEEYNQSWLGDGRRKPVAVLAHSRGDELVEWGQVEDMEACLSMRQGREKRDNNNNAEQGQEGEEKEKEKDGQGGWNGIFRVLEIEGRHDEIWQKGEEMARAIRVALDMLSKSEGENEIGFS